MKIAQLNGQLYNTLYKSGAYVCANVIFRAGRKSLERSSTKTRTAITQSKAIKLSDSQTSRRSASDTVRGPTSGFSSPDVVVEQRHI